MKLREDPLFIGAALVLFYPIGLFILLRSELPKKTKWLMSIGGAVLFLIMLSAAFIGREAAPDPRQFEVTATRKTLNVGQSGGLSVGTEDYYLPDFDVQPENDILAVEENLYTAERPGECRLTVTFGSEQREVLVTVLEGEGTKGTVYASPSGERYHNAVSHAGKRAVEMSEEDALRSGKTPCKVCYDE